MAGTAHATKHVGFVPLEEHRRIRRRRVRSAVVLTLLLVALVAITVALIVAGKDQDRILPELAKGDLARAEVLR